MYIAVTGSSGTLGRATVDRLRADGHDVDRVRPAGTPGAGFTRVDLVRLRADARRAPRRHGPPRRTRRDRAPRGHPRQRTGSRRHDVREQPRCLVPRAVRGPSRRHPHGRLRLEHHGDGLPVRRCAAGAPGRRVATPARTTPMASARSSRRRWRLSWPAGDADASITALRFTNVVAPDAYDTFDARRRIRTYRRDLLGSWIDAARRRRSDRARACRGASRDSRSTTSPRPTPARRSRRGSWRRAGFPALRSRTTSASSSRSSRRARSRSGSASGLATTGGDGCRRALLAFRRHRRHPLTAPAARPFMMRWFRNR